MVELWGHARKEQICHIHETSQRDPENVTMVLRSLPATEICYFHEVS